MYIKKLWMESLDLDPSFMEGLLKQDNKIMAQFGIASLAIQNGKYKNNKTKQRLKIEATKNEFIDAFLIRFLKRKNIIITIITTAIKNYWSNDYDRIMEELDRLLIKPKPKPKPKIINKCNCKNISFGFCFCVDDKGNFYTKPNKISNV